MEIETVQQILLSSLLTSKDSDIYVKNLKEDINKNKVRQAEINSECEKIKELQNLLDNMSETARKTMLYKVNPVCMLPLTFIHTGEYKIKIGSDMFSLNSLKETNRYLNKKHADLIEQLDVYKVNLNELERRLDFVEENKPGKEELLELSNMPNEIVSDKGVAIKMKRGFEILEFESEPVITPKQRRQKNNEKSANIDVFKLLNNLEKEEGEMGYLDSI